MAEQILNGITQIKAADFVPAEAAKGVLYFVRTSLTNGEEGYVFLNGRKYGNFQWKDIIGELEEGKTVADIIAELEERVKATEDAIDEINEWIESADTLNEKSAEEIAKVAEDVEAVEERVDAAEERLDAIEQGIATLTEETNNTLNELDNKISANTVDIEELREAIASLPEDMVVEGGSVEVRDGETVLVLTIKGGDEVVIPASDLVDTYKAGDEYITVENYEISLNIDKVKEILNIEAIENTLNETVEALGTAQEAIEANAENIAAQGEALSGLSEEVEDLRAEFDEYSENNGKGSITAGTYSDAIASLDEENIGQIVYLTQSEEITEGAASGTTVPAGAYIVVPDGKGGVDLQKLDTRDVVETDLADIVDGIKASMQVLSASTVAAEEDIEDLTDRVEALEDAKEYFVKTGRVEEIEGETYIVLELENQDEPVKIKATDLVDVYTNGDDFIVVEDHKISFDIDELKKAIDLDNLATKDDIDNITADDIAVAEDIEVSGETVVEAGTSVNDVLANIYEALAGAKMETEANKVVEGDYIKVEEDTEGTKVSVKVSEDEGNMIKMGADGGLFAAIYYQCLDEEDLEATAQ